MKDIAPLTMGMNFPNVLVVPSSLGVKASTNSSRWHERQPGKLNYGSTGVASASHLAGELFNATGQGRHRAHPLQGRGAGDERAAGRAHLDVLRDHVHGRTAHHRGKLIPLATTGLARAPFLPDLPTVSEAGLKGFTATNWYAFVASSRMPAPCSSAGIRSW